MQKSRTIFIWDVHGCYKELKLLLKRLKIQDNDKIYFVWDIINKWPDSYKVLNYIYKNRSQFKCVIGNNEVNFLNYLEWNFNSKHKIFNKLRKKIYSKNKDKLIQYLKELPLFIEEEGFLLIHWWLNPNKSLEDHSIDEITRIREYNWTLWYKLYRWEKKVIYWHNAFDWLQIRENTLWLDSWCVYWKSLTAYILETWEIYSQNALDIYLNVFKNNSLLDKIIKIFK
jgi:hypothetical protein